MEQNKSWKVWVESGGAHWRTRWRGAHGRGQKVFLYKKDAQELRDALKQRFQRRDAGLPPLPAPAELAARKAYPAFRRDYLAWLRQWRAERTHYNAARSLDLWEEFAGPEFPVSRRQRLEAGGKAPEDFTLWMLQVKKKADGGAQHVNHVRLRLRHLKAAVRWAYKEGYIDYDPFLHFEMPPAVPVARLLRPEEAQALVAELPDIVRRAFFFALFTGLRVGEVLRLDWAGVERRAGGRWYLTVLKSKTRRARAETKTQGIHARAIEAMGPPAASGPVFPVTLSRLEQRLRAAVVKLGLGRVRWHDLRHTWATYLMQEVRDLGAVMPRGGWVTPQAAMLYQHDTDERRDVTLKMRYEVPTGPLNTPVDGADMKKEVLKK